MADRSVIDLRPLGISQVPMLGRYDYRAAQEVLSPHAHPRTMEICYLAKGRQLYRVGDTDFVLKGGDVFVTYPAESHSSGETPEEKGTLYWLQLSVANSRRGFLNCQPREGRTLLRHLRHLPHRHFAGEPALARVLDEIFALADRPADPLRRITIQNRLVDFLLRVIACSKRSPRASISPAISALLRYIETCAHQALPLAALAARVGLSLPRFKARFKQEVGLPPAEYVLRCKIDAAKRRLAQPNASVTAVALDLGFSSSQYFATVFKRYTGCRPRDFRRQLC